MVALVLMLIVLLTAISWNAGQQYQGLTIGMPVEAVPSELEGADLRSGYLKDDWVLITSREGRVVSISITYEGVRKGRIISRRITLADAIRKHSLVHITQTLELGYYRLLHGSARGVIDTQRGILYQTLEGEPVDAPGSIVELVVYRDPRAVHFADAPSLPADRAERLISSARAR